MQNEILLIWCDWAQSRSWFLSYRKISLWWCNITAATGASGVCFYVLLFHNSSLTVQFWQGKCFPCCFKPWGHCGSKCLWNSLSFIIVIWVGGCISGIVSIPGMCSHSEGTSLGSDICELLLNCCFRLFFQAKWECLFWLLTQDILC